MVREKVRTLAEEIARAESTVVLAGAGLSTASGIPDFRGDDGIWSKYDPQKFTIHSLRADPESFWSKYLEVNEELLGGEDFQPNSAHESLAEMTDMGQIEAIITQNVDGLQEEAGTDSEKILKIHGDASKVVCMDCDQEFDIEPRSYVLQQDKIPPQCESCEGIIKPGGVLFGEQLPRYELYQSQHLSEKSDVFLVVGSSLTVEPVASFPESALKRDATVSIVNLQSTRLDQRADLVLHEDVTEVLPQLSEDLKEYTNVQ